MNSNFNFNTDGFNERHTYIHNEIDKNKKIKNIDNSFVKMKVNENKPDIETSSVNAEIKTTNNKIDIMKTRIDFLRNNLKK